MKSDLDHLMEEASLDALLVNGPALHNPNMSYFTGLVHLSYADLFKVRGLPPVLFYQPMERDEAALTGLKRINLQDYDARALLKEAGGDRNKALALRYQRMFQDVGVHGRVALYGHVSFGPMFAVMQYLQELLPEVELVGESKLSSVLIRARMTKDEDEIDHIRNIGKATVAVVGEVADFLASHKVHNKVLITPDDKPLTIGEVKQYINLRLAMRGAENPEGTIFAIGNDAGVPHSTGNNADPIELGKTIVFDIFPCEAGGGYFYDFTRTWCLGYAPDDVLQAYEDVYDVYHTVSAAIKPHTPCRQYQILTCEQFEAKGHPTVLHNPKTTDGYVHSLAHGVGLDVHEGPSFHSEEINNDQLLPGSVITIEPGLYYPKRGYGIRIEDTVWVRPDGSLEILVDFSKDLVIQMSAK